MTIGHVMSCVAQSCSRCCRWAKYNCHEQHSKSESASAIHRAAIAATLSTVLEGYRQRHNAHGSSTSSAELRHNRKKLYVTSSRAYGSSSSSHCEPLVPSHV